MVFLDCPNVNDDAARCGGKNGDHMAEVRKFPEKRRVPRLHVSFPVVVNWGRKQFRWLAREFSEYGILLNGSNEELVGEDLKLTMRFDPEAEPLEVQGVVAYSTETGVGVRFKNVSPEAQHALTYYVKQHGIGINRK